MRSRCKITRPVAAAKSLVVCAFALFALSFNIGASGQDQNKPEQKPIDPKAWGGNHVGKPVPEYVAGDECLFCHRNDVGPSWNDNRHNRSVRELAPDSEALAALKENPALKGLADAISLVMGETHRQRFLKPSAAYGQLDLFSVAWVPPGHG